MNIHINKIAGIILLLFVLTVSIYSNDKSSLYIDLLTTNPPSHSFVLTDPFGKKVGIKSFINGTGKVEKSYKEIQNSYSIYEMSTDALSNDNLLPIKGRVEIGLTKGVVKGRYTLVVYSLSDSEYFLDFRIANLDGNRKYFEIKSFSSKENEQSFLLNFDPTPGAPPPVLTKVVTFQTIRDDLNVAYKLNQIGNGKFIKSLIKMVDVSEKLSKRCEKSNKKSKPECYRPSVVILRMISKRLEIVNRLCNNPEQCKPKCKKEKGCDIDKALKTFEKKYKKDKELKKFFKDWDKDEWHKYKKHCKRFVTDEALEIISSDINWLIKSFGEEVWKDYKKELKPHIPEKYKKLFK